MRMKEYSIALKASIQTAGERKILINLRDIWGPSQRAAEAVLENSKNGFPDTFVILINRIVLPKGLSSSLLPIFFIDSIFRLTGWMKRREKLMGC